MLPRVPIRKDLPESWLETPTLEGPEFQRRANPTIKA